jgi:ketosteroid isomerase-like protein
MTGGSERGEAVSQKNLRLAGAWDYFHVTPERYLEGHGVVLALGRPEGRGLNSGATVDSALGMAFDVRDGMITRIRGYLDRDEALAAVGLGGSA